MTGGVLSVRTFPPNILRDQLNPSACCQPGVLLPVGLTTAAKLADSQWQPAVFAHQEVTHLTIQWSFQ